MSAYAKSAGAIRRACVGKDVTALTAALEDWPHGEDDPAYVAAMNEFDTFSEQLRVVKVHSRAETCLSQGRGLHERLAQ